MLAALRRLGLLLVATSAGVGAVSALIGLAAGASLGRALSVGFYLVGAFLIVLGFFAGSRGPLRPRGIPESEDAVSGLFGIGIAVRGARRATGQEHYDSLATAAIFLGIGIWLIFLGVVADTSVHVV